jgi:thiol-disulfide isomerase/thioredoxin
MRVFVRKSLRTLVLTAAVAFALGVQCNVVAGSVQTLPDLAGGSGWLNGATLTRADLQGKVVLVDFWEYTCINCLHTLPYLEEWFRRYKDAGFVIVGIHTPEFSFSADTANIDAADKRLGVRYPVLLDPNGVLWKRFGNHEWPHEYLYDQAGNLVEDAAGEGNYQETEAKIQALLKARNPQLRLPALMALLPQDNYTKPGSVCYPHTPEVQAGILRGPGPANLARFMNPAAENNFADAGSHQDGIIYLRGFWRTTDQAAVSAGDDGSAALKYHAIQVVAVMRPEDGHPIRVAVTQDGRPVARQDAGPDIQYGPDGSSYVDVNAPRAYDIIMNKHYGEHEVALAPQRFGLGLYSFDFESCEVGSDK